MVLSSAGVLRGSGRDLDYFANTKRFLGNFFPPDFSVAGQTMIGLWETFQMAVMATAFAIILSIPIAIAGARTLSPPWLVFIARMLMNGIRTIPSLIWALIAVAVVGPNTLAGVIGLTFYSIGYLGKFFSDAFESVDVDVAKALRALGARTIQAFQYGLWPHAKPLVWSYSLWMLDTTSGPPRSSAMSAREALGSSSTRTRSTTSGISSPPSCCSSSSSSPCWISSASACASRSCRKLSADRAERLVPGPEFFDLLHLCALCASRSKLSRS